MTDQEVEKALTQFIGNIKLRYPKKLKDIDLRCVYSIGMVDLKKQKLPVELPETILLNNALIFCAADHILKHSKDITWDLLLTLKTQKPYLGIDIR